MHISNTFSGYTLVSNNYEIFGDRIVEKNIYFTRSEYYKMILIYPHRPIYCYY
jgi:hypothetical protein